MKLRGAPIAVLDFETTGVDPLVCMPVSAAVVLIAALGDSEPYLAYSTRINPGMPIPPESTEVHGIRDEDVLDAPCPETACDEIMDTIGEYVIAAYNWPYDWRILWRCHTGDPPPLIGLCGYVMAKTVDKYQAGKKLEQVAQRRGLSFDAHDADADAMVTAKLLPIFLRELGRGVRRQDKYGRWHDDGPWCEPADLQSVEAFWDWTRKTGAQQEREFKAYLAKEGKTLDSTFWMDLEARP